MKLCDTCKHCFYEHYGDETLECCQIIGGVIEGEVKECDTYEKEKR